MAMPALSETIGGREAAAPLRADLAEVVERQLPGEPRAAALIGTFLGLARYDRTFAHDLIRLGRTGAHSWNLRLLAAMMLASQCLRMPEHDAAEFEGLLDRLGLLAADRLTAVADVLRQGYTSRELTVFRGEFLRHLRRLERIERRLRGKETTVGALEDFLAIARDPCKVALARYLFSPEEVVERVGQQLEVSSGLTCLLDEPGAGEAQAYLANLPHYEREIVRGLSRRARIYWACERTSNGINRLVENPLGTVACTVKPPGSALEIEIKRTGLCEDFPLSVAFSSASGDPVPPSHRLQGGGSAAGLRWESNHAAILSAVYRAAHQREAPLSKLLALASYRSVPVGGRAIHLLDYFTDPEIFGPNFQKMRRQMKQCVSAYDQQFGRDFAHLPGEAGLTGRFLYHVLPCQALLAQTSSYRIDTLAGYFSRDGADIYFKQGLKRERYHPDEARLLVDALLDEVLGIYVAPGVQYVDHARYLEAAYAIPQNRQSADRLYLAAVTELGTLWGTVMALGGFTYGESFVGRNVGLKSCFADGEWSVRLISMDHDNLHIPDEEEEVFWPQGALRTAQLDECFIRGNPGRPKQVERSALYFLAQIYQVESAERVRSFHALEQAMAVAYRRTTQALASDPKMRHLFSKSYRRHLRDWNAIAADYLGAADDEAQLAECKERTRAFLARRLYGEEVIKNYLTALEKHGDIVKRFAFLYLPSDGLSQAEAG
jgi:hypothetical protein